MNKLVRDKIPELMKSQGKNPVIRVVSDEEYLHYLYQKLKEEVEELIQDETAEEIADILEVVDALCAANGFDWDHIQKIKSEKSKTRGGFTKGFVVEKMK